MSDSPLSIKCKKCKTKFFITHNQLYTANRFVRCGFCFDVFSIDQEKIKAGLLSIQSKQPVRNRHRNSTHKTNMTQKQTNIFKTKDQTIQQYLDFLAKNKILILSSLIALFLCMLFSFIFLQIKDSTHSDKNFIKQAFCTVFNCSSPIKKDITAIKSIELVVRENKEKSGYIIIDTVLINQAEFSQPWPKLILTFTDIDGNLLVKKVFKAQDYLGGELANTEFMPENQAIHLSLDMRDPGEKAMNYQLTFKL